MPNQSDEIEKLKEVLNEVAQNRIGWEENIEKVLRDHLKSHIVVARDQLTNKDKIIIFREFDKAIEDQLKKLDAPKEQTEKKEACKHENTSSSSDPLIWYICHDCGAHLNQAFKEISSKSYALHKKVLEDSGGSELIRNSKLLEKLDEKGVEMETILQTEPDYDGILTIQAMVTHEHMLVEQHKKEIKELIEDLQTDLDSLSPDIPYQYEPLNKIKKKWQGRIK